HAVIALVNQLRQLSGPVPNADLFVGSGTAARHQKIRQGVERGRQRDQQRAQLLSKYREEFLELDHLVHLDALNRAQRKPGPLRWIAGLLARRKMQPYALTDLPPTETLLADLEA